ncbi:HAMP domain-containing sensor histidine kinase [Paenibacillus sp. 481]|uniref:HAMP domain-containing sensor histidine kinase n=1 Tax=Paenibacillus sp. 481 TaxID=2835869 RepID=UPI001E577A18|nr:ATP-binding protein [Paenibacillus sp. 481]UHA72205.1 HAMP domain-containing histidine kinase [Paenibacillus sp. 481]
MNLRNKIHLYSTVWLILITLVINTSIFVFFYRMTTSEELERVRLHAEQIATGISKFDLNSIPVKELLDAYLPPDGMLRIIKPDGNSVANTATAHTEADLLKYKKLPKTYKNVQTEELKQIQGMTLAVAYVPLIWKDGSVAVLEVTENLASMEENLKMLRYILIVASLVVLVPSFLAGRMLSQVILRPINNLIRTMEEIQRRSMFKKLELKGSSKDELYKLGNTFNKMMDLLKDNFDKQQQFVSDASHELKTPLTVIESYASMLKRWGMNDPEVLAESVDAIYAEAGRMKDMANQMLSLAGQDAEWDIQLSKVNVTAIGQETIKMLKMVHDRTITFHGAEHDIIGDADEKKLKQLMYILLDNALKYSSHAVELHVGYTHEAQDAPSQHSQAGVFFKVKDHGIGIPQEDIEHIFDRFYRVDKARSRETGGTGLGLSIAKRIVDAHSGEIEIDSREGEGTSFIVTIPFAAHEQV